MRVPVRAVNLKSNLELQEGSDSQYVVKICMIKMCEVAISSLANIEVDVGRSECPAANER